MSAFFISKNIYDPNRGYLDNIEQRMLAAGITGAALKGGLEIIAKVRTGKNPTTLSETQNIFNVEPKAKSQVELNAKQIEYRSSGNDVKAKLNEKLKLTEQAKVSEKLNQIREQLSPQAKVEFDAKRIVLKNDSNFIKLIGDKNAVKMFEGIAQRKAELPAKLKLEKEAINKARLQIDTPEFANKPLVKDALNVPKEPRFEVIKEQISIEIVKSKLEAQYPKTQGFEIQTGVEIYKDSGYSTTTDWLNNHPEISIKNAEKFLIEKDGKVWQPETDMDIAVVKKDRNGKFEIIHTEEVKAGGKSASVKAQEQVKATQDALEKIKNGDNSVKIFFKKGDVTSDYKVNQNIKSVTRGADDKTNFDEKIGLTSQQLNQLATELVNKYRKGGN